MQVSEFNVSSKGEGSSGSRGFAHVFFPPRRCSGSPGWLEEIPGEVPCWLFVPKASQLIANSVGAHSAAQRGCGVSVLMCGMISRRCRGEAGPVRAPAAHPCPVRPEQCEEAAEQSEAEEGGGAAPQQGGARAGTWACAGGRGKQFQPSGTAGLSPWVLSAPL